MILNTDFVKDHSTRSSLLHCAGNLPAVCRRDSGSTCGLGSCSGAGACTVAIVPTDVVSRTFLSAGYPKRKDRDSIRLMNTYHLFGCCTMELSSHSKRLAVIAIFWIYVISDDDGDDDNGALYQGALVVCHSIEDEREDARLIKSS